MNDLARLITDKIDPEAAFTNTDRKDAARLLDACNLALVDGFSPADVHIALARLRRERLPAAWFDAVRKAIDAAPIDPVDRAGMRAAFQMATVILFDVWEQRELKIRARLF